MAESFITAFIIYFVVIDPIGNSPIFLALTSHLDRAKKTRIALEGTLYASLIMLFFALCGRWILHYLNISDSAFTIAGGLILFTVALEMLTSKRQARKQKATEDPEGGDKQSADNADSTDGDNIAVFPLAIPLLAGPASILSVMVVTADIESNLQSYIASYGALIAVMVITAMTLSFTVRIERFIDERATMVFSRITAIILAALSVQYVLNGLSDLGII